MARTTINSQGVPAGTIVASDLTFPLADFSSTGIDDNASSTSLTIDSSGNIAVTGTVDGRDLATDGTKLDGIAASADVTPSWVPSSDPSYLTGITAQSIENLSDVNSMTPSDGQVLTWDNTNSYWYAATPSSYSDSSVDTHLNTSTANANEVLSWTGSDYDWVAQSGGGGGITTGKAIAMAMIFGG